MGDRVYDALLNLPLCGVSKYFIRSIERRFFLNGSNVLRKGVAVPVSDSQSFVRESVNNFYEASENAYLELRDELDRNRNRYVVSWANIEICGKSDCNSRVSFELSSLGPLCRGKGVGFSARNLESGLLEWFEKWSK